MLFREGLSGIWLVLGTLILGFGIMALLVDVFTVVNLLVLIAFAVYIRQTRNKRWNTHLLVLLVLDLLFLSVLIGNTFDFEVFGLVFTDRSLLLMLDVLLLGFFVFYLARFRNRRWTIYAFILAAFVAYVSGIDAVYQYVLKDHQRARITALFDPDYDPRGINWNSTQSKIAIGSGGIIGKGYLQGTQTKFDFVPQQHTDFIFCTIGEEWGWLGTTILIAAFFLFLSQILYMAEECKSKFGRILGYSVAGMFFVHIAINIAMTVGLAPVIGIPLPFFSYGGSALISFTAMYFLVLKYYSVRGKMLRSSL
jgi:rod shape determining protein RodA